MIRILGSLFVTATVGGPVAFFWWALDEDGSSPCILLFFVGWLTFVLWPEPRRGRPRRAKTLPR